MRGVRRHYRIRREENQKACEMKARNHVVGIGTVAMAALIFFGMACGSGNALPTAAPTPVYDYESLIADLGNAETEFDERATFSVGARDVAISGAISGGTIKVYEFPDEQAANSQAGRVSLDGYTITVPLGGDLNKSVHSDWLEPPHYYKKGRVIVFYVGGDPAFAEMLESMLGPEFAGPNAQVDPVSQADR